MSERYTRLFALEENLYSEGSPIAISAGALLKDNKTGGVLVQLKIKNISCKTIKAAIVRVSTFDSFGKPIDGDVEKEYLDLSVARDGEFGQKELISLPNVAARGFTAAVSCVGFADGTVWNYAGEEQTALPRPKLLAEAFGEEELAKQYRLKYGAKSQVFPEEYKDVWFCACGALNQVSEKACHVCGRKKAEMFSLDRDALTAEKDERLKAEAEEYRRAIERAEAARKKAEKEAVAAAVRKAQKRKKTAAIAIPIVCACIALAVLTVTVFIPDKRYNDAVVLMESGDYEAAITAFETMNGYKDSEVQILNCRTAILDAEYDSAVRLFQEGKYEEAIEAFEALAGYRNSKDQIVLCKTAIKDAEYDKALELLNRGEYVDAYTAFSALNGYKDSRKRKKEILTIDPTVAYHFAEVGDTITFGRYEQDNNRNNGAEDIKWTVLAKEENRLLLISQYDIESLPYNSSGGNTTWETCSLRKWLNTTFLTTAFTSKEQDIIPTVEVHAEKTPGFRANPGNDTRDRVFLLSGREAEKYLSEAGTSPTKYVVSKHSEIPEDYDGNYGWWIRSPGNEGNTAVFVGPNGLIERDNEFWATSTCGVRPALWIDLGT